MTARLPERDAPLGVFDSGLGGLTVVRALREALPDEHIVYLGDTARVPYGTKGPATVIKYALALRAAPGRPRASRRWSSRATR